MKRAVILYLTIIIMFVTIKLINDWRCPNNPAIPQRANHEKTVPPSNNNQNKANQDDVIKILDILGQSDNLTTQQWTAMLEWRSDAKQSAVKNPQILYINGKGSKPQVALTFDDGPDDEITPKVLDVLKQYQVQATFFFTANRLNLYKDVAKRAYTEGNQIASHAYSHQELSKMNAEDIDKEIIASDEAFERVLGVKPAMIRPPYGAINQDVLDVCTREQEKVILWSIDTLDWSQPEPEHIARNVLDNVRPGEIILMHSCKYREATVQALPLIIEGLQEKGYQMVNLSELLQKPAYKR